jgi:hypothetical protein
LVNKGGNNYMTNGKEYYEEELKILRQRSSQCKSDFIGSLVYFMSEANIHPSGIPDEVAEEVKEETLKFVHNCDCMNKKQRSEWSYTHPDPDLRPSSQDIINMFHK